MLKIYMQDKSLRGAKLVNRSMFGETYLLKSGDYFKLFNQFIRLELNADHSLERKIMQAKPILEVPEIIIPSKAVFNMQNRFVGYVIPPAEGVDFNHYDDNYTLEQRSNLVEYGEIFANMTDVVRRANAKKIVFPDLCTCDNIFINNGKISFIDYDGIQVGKHKVYAMSTSLGEQEKYCNKKYMDGDLFTSELDKTSLVYLYFLSAFNIDLNQIGKIAPGTKKRITLYEVFDILGLQDYDFMQKVYKTISADKPGEYIDEDVMRIADEYTMEAFGPFMGGHYIKKLTKK